VALGVGCGSANDPTAGDESDTRARVPNGAILDASDERPPPPCPDLGCSPPPLGLRDLDPPPPPPGNGGGGAKGGGAHGSDRY